MCTHSSFTWKDGIYLVGFITGLITFIKAFRKKEYCELNFKTEMGDEEYLYICSTKGDLYNLKILCDNEKISVVKYKNLNISKAKHERDLLSGDKSLFFLYIKEDDVIEIKDANKIEPIRFEYEDKYSNKYYQIIQFDKKADKDFNSRRYYKISKRYATPFWKRII